MHKQGNRGLYSKMSRNRRAGSRLRAYTAPTEEAALTAFETLERKWGKKYMLAVGVWERNWDRISTMFEFTPEIRTLIYTTNPIESFHRQLRKVTKNRGVFPDDNSLLKLLYLATQDGSRARRRVGSGR